MSLALAGFVAAQTTGGTGTGGSGTTTCPDGSMVAIGMTCPTTTGTGTGTTSMTTCPNGTQVAAGTTCPPTMTTCPDGSQVVAGTTCPTQESKCTSASGKWCKNSDGATGWCSYSSTTPCPAYDAPSCTAQSGEWCAYTSGTGGWCATNGAKCPINDEPTCTAKGRPWCKSAGGTVASGWCGDVGYKCPANDEASCKAQGSQWCTSAGGTATSGWCQTSGDCPINDSGTCSAKARVWCPNSYGSGGWCASAGYTCNGTATSVPPTYQTPSSTPTTTNFTCSDGTKVSDSSKCPIVTTTPPPTTMSWPQSETECTKYKGVWCPPTANMYGTSMGSCMMAGQSCPKSTSANMMTCWDGTQVPSSSSCSSTPSNSADCTAKGGLWCASMATGSGATSGWCTSKDNGCPKYPPAGQMTCPDNQTYVSKLSDCPTWASTTIQSDINYKTCPNGSLIKKDAECPKQINYIVCPNGTKVIEGTQCSVTQKENDVTVCAAKGYLWCVDKNSGKSGYCSTSGTCGVATDQEQKEERLGLNAKEVRQLEQTKKNLLRKLDTLEKFFVKVKDTESLAKTNTLRGQIKALPQDTAALDAIDLISDDVSTLGDIKDAALNNGVDTQSEQDQALQKKALKQLKSNVARFASQLAIIQGRITRLERGGAAVPAEIKDLVSKAQGLVKQIQSATSFDEARDAAESLRDAADDVNGALATLEQITRIQGLTKAIAKEIGSREAGFKRAQTLAKKLKVDVADYIGDLAGLLKSIRESFNKAKGADFGESDPLEFVQANIIDKLDEADSKLANLNALTNLKGSIKLINAQISKFDAQIKRLEKKKKDVTEMKGLLAELKDHNARLQALARQKITEDNLSEIVDELSIAANLSEQLNDSLQLNTPSVLERELKKGIKASGSLKGIDIPSLETSLLRAYRVATFVRQTPSDIAEYVSIGGHRKVNTTRGSFAQDQ